MPSIDSNQQPSQSVVQFFNMFGSQPNAHHPPPTVTKTPNRSTHTRKNSKQLQARASSLSPKPNRQNKLPKINNNNHNKHNTTPNHKFNAKHDNRNNANVGSNSGRTPQRNSTHRGSCSSRDTGKQQQHKTTTNHTSKHKNNCPQNENNHSDSSLSVKSSKSSFVKLATLTNKSDPDSDNGGSTNNHQRYNTRARYQRNSESSFHFENQANSELFAGSSSAPDAKSLPLPPTAWLGIGSKPSGNNLNNVPKNHLKNLKNNAPQLTESNSLNPTVQNLFASMALVSTSA